MVRVVIGGYAGHTDIDKTIRVHVSDKLLDTMWRNISGPVGMEVLGMEVRGEVRWPLWFEVEERFVEEVARHEANA